MAFVVRKAKNFSNLPKEGNHAVEIEGFEKHPTQANKINIIFKKKDGSTLKGMSDEEYNQDSLVTAMLISLVGNVPEKVDLEKFIGEECIITIAHKIGKTGKTYANVVSILPASEDESDSDEDDSDSSDEDDSDSSDEDDESDDIDDESLPSHRSRYTQEDEEEQVKRHNSTPRIQERKKKNFGLTEKSRNRI